MTSKPTSAVPSEDWAEHIAAWRASKLSRAAYCRGHHLKLHAVRGDIAFDEEPCSTPVMGTIALQRV